MPSSTPLSPDTRTRLTRRGVLTLPALAGAWAVLAGCGALKKDGVASSGKSLGAASPRAAVATSPGPHGGVVLSTEYQGAPLTVEVGPVAVKGKHTVARFHISTDSKEDVYLSQAFALTDNVGTTADVQMMSLEQSLVYVELGRNTEDLSGAVTKGASKDAFPVFSALNDGVQSVEMLLPSGRSRSRVRGSPRRGCRMTPMSADRSIAVWRSR